MIDGVELKQLVTHRDERGFFREIARNTDAIAAEDWAQVSHSLMHSGVVKAWHVHPKQIDWWYVPVGDLKVALYDTREVMAVCATFSSSQYQRLRVSSNSSTK